MDIFEKFRNRGPLGQYMEYGHGYFMFPKLEGEIGNRMKFRGEEMLVWSLNNYIGLANHPEVREADARGAREYGLAAPMGARIMSGHTDMHEQLEKELAAFVKRDAAYLLNFGYQGMFSIIQSVCGRNDVIVYDSEAHACIVDGAQLHFGKRFVYPHNDINSCAKQLERATRIVSETGGGILVITEGVYGMSGDLGKLKEIVALKKDYDFRLLIDDAHGFGTMGPTGAGTDEHFHVQKGVDIYFATFAKAMAGIGAFVAGDEYVIKFLQYNMRSQIFAKSLPMPIVLGSLKRLELLRDRPELRNNLWKIVGQLQGGLKEAGFNLGNTNSCVTPVFLQGGPEEATCIIKDLRDNYKIFCSMVTYPVVPKGVIMLRLIPTAVHTVEDVEYTINAFRDIARRLQKNEYSKTKFPKLD
ncbi:MAG: aminotransferase class I/II-fold pyridoxal phosphate-dependent enzyme [Bacteroidetes bacterium]|nr:aminotransferase class I/II-fold pyridoxal phosphate-dependent enzyme [Bacteroidota bacterium]MBU1720707.1 aminotransferase class I/II-fold pyridoxal phosphate-dependent enzyme [Bacteroidota bacterium]